MGEDEHQGREDPKDLGHLERPRTYLVELWRDRRKGTIQQISEQNRLKVEEFVTELGTLLNDKGLGTGLVGLERAENLPMVYIRAEPAVAEQIKRMPAVREVLEDRDRLSMPAPVAFKPF